MLAHARHRILARLCVAFAMPALWAQSPPTFIDTGVAVSPTQIGDSASMILGQSVVVTNVLESSHGSDRNGDGDLLDVVPLVTLVRSGSQRNLGAAIVVGLPVRISARFVTFFVDEAADGDRDHNGDGDALDRVLFVHDLVRATTSSTGITLPATYALGVRFLATLESEATLGLGDVNGDGFVAQTIVLRDLIDGTTTYAGALPVSVHVGAGRILWQSRELGYGDLNGDGDTQDWFLTAMDESSGLRFTLPIESLLGPDRPLLVTADFVACGVSEYAFGPRDLNGDGDATDALTALILRDIARPRFVDVRYAGAVGSDGVVAFGTAESVTGVDRNGDGDTYDTALQIYSERGRTLTSLALAVRYDTFFGLNATVDHGLVAFAVSESAQGQLDLNGDGDAVDPVVYAYDSATGATASSGLATTAGSFGGLPPLRVSAGRIAFLAALPGQTRLVAHVWRPFGAGAAIVNLGLLAHEPYHRAFGLERGILAMCARENGVDANGDGDTNDMVVRVHDLATGNVLETGLVVVDPMGPPPFLAGDGFVVFAAHESTSLGGDRNGDFDVLDDVPVVLRLRH